MTSGPRRACLLGTQASTVGNARQMHTHRRTLHVRYAHAHKHTHRINRAHAIQAYNTRVEYRQVHNMPIHVHLAATSTSRLICWLARALHRSVELGLWAVHARRSSTTSVKTSRMFVVRARHWHACVHGPFCSTTHCSRPSVCSL